jgi:hypothetical protein
MQSAGLNVLVSRSRSRSHLVIVYEYHVCSVSFEAIEGSLNYLAEVLLIAWRIPEPRFAFSQIKIGPTQKFI